MFGRSDHHQASLRKVADERIKKADERHKLILKERQEKAAKNAARIKKAEKRKVGKRVFFGAIYHGKNDHFTKTGSGQRWES
jgi:hypothetical protein